MNMHFKFLSKIVMAVTLSCTLFGAVYADQAQGLAPEPTLSNTGWQMLFNGQTLDGWSHVGSGQFILASEVMYTDGADKMGVLWYTRKKFGDCVIRVVYRVNIPEANSGVFVRVGHVPKSPWDMVNNGFEVQIQDTGDAYHRTGAIYSMTPAAPAPTHPIGQWNTMDIFLKGGDITTYVNGQKVSSYMDGQAVPPQQQITEPTRNNPRPTSGYIGVQNHDAQVNGVMTHVWFKEISVHPL